MDTNLSNQNSPAKTQNKPPQTIPSVQDKPFRSPTTKSSSPLPSVSTPSSPPTPTLTPPPSSPITPPPGIPPEKAEEIPVKKDINFLSKALLVLGPLIMVGLLTASIFNLTKRPKTPIQAPAIEVETIQITKDLSITKEKKEKWDKWLDNIPKNPNQVTATCLSTGQNLTSGQPASCPDPQFTWSGEEPQEPGTKIEGYYVYFGKKKDLTTHPNPGFMNATDPRREGEYQENNTYAPKDLERSKTYYLFVQAVSDSQNPSYQVGYSVINRQTYETRPADVLFKYTYE